MNSNDRYERIIEEHALSELTDADIFFRRLSGIDPENVPEKYGNCVNEARQLLIEKCTAKVVYQRLMVKDISESGVTICNGDDCFQLNGEMAARVLADSSELYAFVLTLDGYENIPTDDIMLEYMADTWGSAYTECAQANLAVHISDMIVDEDMIRTHVWCPGQFKFDLKNQTTLFSILHPEDINCRLTDRLMMVPVKSASGIIGLVPKGSHDLIKPCDYCKHKPSCPASKNGCAAL